MIAANDNDDLSDPFAALVTVGGILDEDRSVLQAVLDSITGDRLLVRSVTLLLEDK